MGIDTAATGSRSITGNGAVPDMDSPTVINSPTVVAPALSCSIVHDGAIRSGNYAAIVVDATTIYSGITDNLNIGEV